MFCIFRWVDIIVEINKCTSRLIPITLKKYFDITNAIHVSLTCIKFDARMILHLCFYYEEERERY